MPSPPWRYIYSAGVSFRTSTSSKYRWWIWYECPILNWTNFFKTGGHVVGCREFLGCCRCVPGLADWILGYYRGDLALSWNFCETPAICRYCLPRLLPEIQLWSLPSDTLLQVANIFDNNNMEHFLFRQEERLSELCDVGDGGVGRAQEGRSSRPRRPQSQARLWHHSAHLHHHHYYPGQYQILLMKTVFLDFHDFIV